MCKKCQEVVETWGLVGEERREVKKAGPAPHGGGVPKEVFPAREEITYH